MSDKSKRCVLLMTFRPSQRTLFMARRNWVPLALRSFAVKNVLRLLKSLTCEDALAKRISIYMGHYQKMEKSVSFTIFSHPQLQLSSFSVYNT